jgi:hypothetical protein
MIRNRNGDATINVSSDAKKSRDYSIKLADILKSLSRLPEVRRVDVEI